MTNRSKIYRCIAFFMAILLLFTSLGAAIDMHFCGGHLKSFSLYGKAKNCYELAGEYEKSCSSHPAEDAKKTTCSIGKKDCCQDQFVYLINEQNLPTSKTEVALHSFPFSWIGLRTKLPYLAFNQYYAPRRCR